jgi:hypothetical protein
MENEKISQQWEKNEDVSQRKVEKVNSEKENMERDFNENVLLADEKSRLAKFDNSLEARAFELVSEIVLKKEKSE